MLDDRLRVQEGRGVKEIVCDEADASPASDAVRVVTTPMRQIMPSLSTLMQASQPARQR
jgi:hypothetical protein